MDEKEFKQFYYELTQLACIFEKAILSTCGACEKSEKIYIAEREGVACSSKNDCDKCRILFEKLSEKAQFALKLQHPVFPLPHNKAMKVQCGGLLGLSSVLEPQPLNTRKIENIYAIVTQTFEKFEQLENLPYGEIVKFITHYEPRKRQ
jgi:hypothetical protein